MSAAATIWLRSTEAASSLRCSPAEGAADGIRPSLRHEARVIHYDLICCAGHEFDGWFRDSGAFDLQAQRGQLNCPACGSSTVRRALMAPRLSRGARPPASHRSSSQDGVPDGSAQAQRAGAGLGKSASVPVAMASQEVPSMPDEMRSFLQRVRAEVERRCDYVGPEFADEARRIHKGEAPERAIYGETSPEQAEALEEDGIKVARVPWIPRADS